MRKLAILTVLFGVVGWVGCGGGSGGTTDPSSLPPLTEADKAEIQQRDAEIQAEEQAPAGAPTVNR